MKTKLIIINLLLIIIAFCTIEIISFTIAQIQYKKKYEMMYGQEKYKPFKYSLNMTSARENLDNILHNDMRQPENLYSSKKPILLFGCSYTYGMNLKQEQTFGHKIAEMTERPVYNRAMNGKGLQHMYYQLSNDKFYDEIKSEPEYIIFVFIYHFFTTRLYEYTFEPFDNFFNLRYYPNKTDSNGKLIEKTPFLPKYFNGLYTVKLLEHLNVLYKTSAFNKEKYEDFMFLTLEKSFEEAKKHYPNVKFVVFCFDTFWNEHDKYPDFLDRLRDSGILVIKMNELVDFDYKNSIYNISENDNHPNEYFWNLVTPKFVEKLDL